MRKSIDPARLCREEKRKNRMQFYQNQLCLSGERIMMRVDMM